MNTHTFSELEVSAATYIEIRDKLEVAGYDHAFVDGAIDMHGIGLTRELAKPDESGGMKMAKASKEECEAAATIATTIEDLQKGYYWSDGDGGEDGPTFFDENNPEHLRALYNRLMALSKPIGGGLFRVAFGMHTILCNDILDPEKDYLAIHPRLQPKVVP